MAVFNEPTKWQTSLVNSGDANVIPQSTPAGTGKASFKDGFPQITQIPLGAGGVAPDRKDFNGLFKVLGDSIFYMQNGGLWSYNSAFDYAVGRVVLYNGNLYKCIQANSSTSPKAPTNSAYWVKVVTLADFANFADIDLSNLSQTGLTKIIPTSTILPFAGSTVPNGWLLCNGAGVSRTTFSNLFTKIGTTYGKGDGSTTFNIPDLRDRYIIGANTNVLGTKIAEQLPNINGSVWRSSEGGVGNVSPFHGLSSQSGALSFSTGSYGGMDASGASAQRANRITLNAHSSNSVYTDSGKVYPLSLALNFIIKS